MNQTEQYNQCEGVRLITGRCIKNVNEAQTKYSKAKFKKILCYSCQKKEEVKK